MVRETTRRRANGAGLDLTASAGPVPMSGVTPARQARSEETFLALVNAGFEALKSGGLDAMAIGDIAKAANVSVGAFYGRFENKEAFFTAIQQIRIAQVWEQIQELLNGLDARDAKAHEFIEAIAHFWVSIFRDNRGVYVAAFKHESAQPGAWTPFKRLGWNGSALIVEKLLPRLDAKVDALQVKLAMQFVNGLLVNATINDPGPVELDDPGMEEHVARFLCVYLGVERKPKSIPRAARNSRGGKR